jgi:uncharacterized protein YbjT (DUF2867 family)
MSDTSDVSGTSGMRVFVIGAAGGIGRRLARALTDRGDEVTGLFRDPDQRDRVVETGARAAVGDLVAADVAELARAIAGHDAVVFTAGAHGTGTDRTTAIDGEGLAKAAAAAREAGVRRFVLVSVFPEAGRDRDTGEGFEHYMRVKKRADVHLAATDLDWVIVRPGTLLDDAGTGRVSAGPAVAYGSVSRDDVAAFIAAVLHEPRVNRVIVELTAGEVPVADAVAALVP